MKILLLNLPYNGQKLQRDFACAHSSKADYYWPPIDLVVYSAIFSEQELYFIDGVQDSKNIMERIIEINPDYIFTLVSAISIKEDISLIGKIKKAIPKVKVSASGDLASFEPKRIGKEIDFIIPDFTEREEIRKIVFGKQKRILESKKRTEFSIGIARHELFKKYNYKMPYSYYSPVTSLITNFGCPFRCKFCNSNRLNFKYRNLNEVVEELRYIEKVGIKEVYIRDFTFGIPKLKELLNSIIKSGIKLKWSCEFRVDIANEEILRLMKKAGCFLIFYGGESGNQKTLDSMNKGFSLEQVKKAVDFTKKAGIETLISFIIGFDNETEKDIHKTQEFIMELYPDYVSINVLVPRIGSEFREEINSSEEIKLDNSEAMGKLYSNGKYAVDYKEAIEKKFFFRPMKLLRYLVLSAKTFQRFKNFVKSGASIFLRIK